MKLPKQRLPRLPTKLLRDVEAFLEEERDRRSWGGRDPYYAEADRLLKRVQRARAPS